MWTNLALEKPRIPYLLGKRCESLDKLRFFPLEIRQEQVVSEWSDMKERVYDDIHVIVTLDIVQANIAL